MKKRLFLGLEFGSTRIKAVLIDTKAKVIASGSFTWQNRLLPGGIWSYRIEDAVYGMQKAYAALKSDYFKRTKETSLAFDAFGISGMMHGYLPLDAKGRQLAPFRTWRCTITQEASQKLSDALDFTMPQRWSATHLYQRILDRGKEVNRIASLTTLAGYIHTRLTDEKVAGIGEASGMFPIDSKTGDYDARRLKIFDRLAAKRGFAKSLNEILPRPLLSGQCAGRLTANGARLLDPTGDLKPGALAAPPEGDVQTGMVATNSIAPGTANVSAGTSAFVVIALKKNLTKRNSFIDIAVSPTGAPLAMGHANTCTSDLNAWVKVFGGDYETLFKESLSGAADCAGLVTIPYFSGEDVGSFKEGVPLVVRYQPGDFTRANFMRAHIYSAFATLRLAVDVLVEDGIRLHDVVGHGGIFKTPKIAQQYLANALKAPVTCWTTANEGGAWGMAILAAYAFRCQAGEKMSLTDYLSSFVFAGMSKMTLKPEPAGVRGFSTYLKNFKRALLAERAALQGNA